jgi:hypothetical protein
MKSTFSALVRRIRAHQRGWVFTTRDLLDLGTRTAVEKGLSRLTRDEMIRRIAHGIYHYPRIHKQLGVLAPNPDDVATALAAKTPGSRIQISGARAANLLGLTTQVPAQLVYLTDGPTRRIKVGSQTIQLKRAAPSKFPSPGTRAGLALQAIHALGPETDQEFAFHQLSRALKPADKKALSKLTRYAPGWSHRLIKRLEGV